jgi:1,4-alpha-glucan branching enzyme
MNLKIFEYDQALLPFAPEIEQRAKKLTDKKKELVGKKGSLCDSANGYEYFGFHRTDSGWVYREWAPAADALWLVGDMNSWDRTSLPLIPIGNGVFEIFLSGENALFDGCYVKVIVKNGDKIFERIPLYIRRVLQDPNDFSWCGVITDEPLYNWKKKKLSCQRKSN